jgi:L,D-peptidoglycan transpeptidase YkuD (ErfK/YbiS/YcfS/YnhG family)
MRRVFYRPDRISPPQTRLPVLALAPDMGWCDDPVSPDYNRLIGLPFTASHEKLWREDRLYDLIVELGYNDAPVIAGLGSAIFLHVAAPEFSPTEGCVATDMSSLLSLVAATAPGDRLAIVR